MHYVYFTTNPLVRAGRVSQTKWVMEAREHWLSDQWSKCFCGDCFTLEQIERLASPQG